MVCQDPRSDGVPSPILSGSEGDVMALYDQARTDADAAVLGLVLGSLHERAQALLVGLRGDQNLIVPLLNHAAHCRATPTEQLFFMALVDVLGGNIPEGINSNCERIVEQARVELKRLRGES